MSETNFQTKNDFKPLSTNAKNETIPFSSSSSKLDSVSLHDVHETERLLISQLTDLRKELEHKIKEAITLHKETSHGQFWEKTSARTFSVFFTIFGSLAIFIISVFFLQFKSWQTDQINDALKNFDFVEYQQASDSAKIYIIREK